jgi:hypothetical protein
LVGAQREVALIVRSSRFRLSNFVGHARRVSPGRSPVLSQAV